MADTSSWIDKSKLFSFGHLIKMNRTHSFTNNTLNTAAIRLSLNAHKLLIRLMSSQSAQYALEATYHHIFKLNKVVSNQQMLIILTYRYSTIEHCDYVYRIQQGHIIASGSYAEMVNFPKTHSPEKVLNLA